MSKPVYHSFFELAPPVQERYLDFIQRTFQEFADDAEHKHLSPEDLVQNFTPPYRSIFLGLLEKPNQRCFWRHDRIEFCNIEMSHYYTLPMAEAIDKAFPQQECKSQLSLFS